MANGLSWHGRFANISVYRLVRIGPVAEARAGWIPSPKGLRTALTGVIEGCSKIAPLTDPNPPEAFPSALSTTFTDFARDPVVVGFKSVVCYRTGLDVHFNSGDSSDV